MLSHCRMLLPSIAAVLLPSLATAEEPVLFRRIEPLEVRWGEIELVDGAAVGLVRPPDSKESGLVITTETGTEIQKLPLSAAIVCSERSRREPEAADEIPVASPATRVGALYLAARVDGDPVQWREVTDLLARRAAASTPEGFADFLRQFPSLLTAESSSLKGAFSVAYCATHRDRADLAGDVIRKVENGSVSWGSSTLGDGTAYCGSLVSSLEGDPVRETYTTRFVVRRVREQVLTARTLRLDGTGSATWPTGSGVSFREVPAGTVGYSSSGTDHDGATFAEFLRPSKSDDPQARGPSIVRARTPAAEIPATQLETGVVATRWSWTETERILGAEPQDDPEKRARLDVAYLFPSPPGRIDVEGAGRSAVQRFEASSLAPGIPLLATVLQAGLPEVGPDEMFAVFCEEGAWDRARYCVGRSCAPLLNGVAFCAALDTRLSR